MARRRRGRTQRALAESVGLSARSLVRYFKNERDPDSETIQRLASALGFPTQFFYGPTLSEASKEGPSFRALSKMTARQRDQATAIGTLGVYLADWIDDRFNLPEPSIPQYDHVEPEVAAMAVRAQWGLGEVPIRNITHLLEKHGGRIFALSVDTQNVDAFSFWHRETPLIFLNTGTSAERSRMDVAHELGHLVLHGKGGSQRSRSAEQEAQQFGSTFLMPRGSVLGRMKVGATLKQVVREETILEGICGEPHLQTAPVEDADPVSIHQHIHRTEQSWLSGQRAESHR